MLIGCDLLDLPRIAAVEDGDICLVARQGDALASVVHTDMATLDDPVRRAVVLDVVRGKLLGPDATDLMIYGFGGDLVAVEGQMWALREVSPELGGHIVKVSGQHWWSVTCSLPCCWSRDDAAQLSRTAVLAASAFPLLRDRPSVEEMSHGLDMFSHGVVPQMSVLVRLANVLLDPVVHHGTVRLMEGHHAGLTMASSLDRAASLFDPPVGVGLMVLAAHARMMSGDVDGAVALVVQSLAQDPGFLPAHRLGLCLSGKVSPVNSERPGE